MSIRFSFALQRHHPEYTFQCEVDAVEDGEQQQQQMLLLDDGAGTSAMEQAPEEFVAPTEEVINIFFC